MPKPTQAEVADLVGRLRHYTFPLDSEWEATMHEAADALEALAGEGAEPVAWRWIPNEHHRYTYSEQKPLFTFGVEPLYAAPPAKPAGELPALPEPDGYAAICKDGTGTVIVPPREFAKHNAYAIFTAEQMRAYALRALRERA